MQKSVLMFLCTVLLAGLLLPQAAFAQVRPALVKNVDEPGLVPFSQTFQISITACSCQNCCFLTTAPVPAGKRLVITNVSGFFPLASAVNMGPVTVNAVDPSPFNLVQLLALPVIFRTQWNGGDYPAYELNENVQTFVDAGKVVQLAVFHSSNWNFRTGAVTINGYLVSLN
jgi:hypothetical protein